MRLRRSMHACAQQKVSALPGMQGFQKTTAHAHAFSPSLQCGRKWAQPPSAQSPPEHLCIQQRGCMCRRQRRHAALRLVSWRLRSMRPLPAPGAHSLLSSISSSSILGAR